MKTDKTETIGQVNTSNNNASLAEIKTANAATLAQIKSASEISVEHINLAKEATLQELTATRKEILKEINQENEETKLYILQQILTNFVEFRSNLKSIIFIKSDQNR